MSKSLKLAILLFLIIQVIVSSSFELAHDEAYYWLYSRHLAWGYFDHPPMVAWTIKLFSFLPHAEWSLRLGFIIQQLLALWILLKMLPKKYQLHATLLFIAFPLASFSGLLALPDMPLLFMSAVYCYLLKKYLEEDSTSSTIGLGIVIPLLLYAKYHGILLVFFTLLALPGLLRRKSFYIIMMMSLLLFLPHGWWQYQHEFATLRYHFLERPTSSFSLKRIFDYLMLQVLLAGVLCGPIVWWLVIKFKSLSTFERAMKFNALGIVLFFLLSTFSKKFEANWTIPITIPAIYLAAQSTLWVRKTLMTLLYASAALALIARLMLLLPDGTLKAKRLREFEGWQNWAMNVQKNCGELELVANSYQIASKLSYYLKQEIPALNYHSRKNQFDYWQFEQKLSERSICYLTDKQGFEGQEILTPEGKRLRIVKNLDRLQLWRLKADQKSQQ